MAFASFSGERFLCCVYFLSGTYRKFFSGSLGVAQALSALLSFGKFSSILLDVIILTGFSLKYIWLNTNREKAESFKAENFFSSKFSIFYDLAESTSFCASLFALLRLDMPQISFCILRVVAFFF